MINKENLKKQMLEQIDKLTPVQLSKLCVRVVKEILKRDPVNISIKNNFEQSKKVLVDLMIKHNIEFNPNNKRGG